jgi:F-type H+-transporting ATPase subunit b
MTLAPDWTIFAQFGQLLLLLFLLHFLVFKPVLSLLKRREETIHSLTQKGEDTAQDAENMAKAYEEGLKERKIPILAERDNTLRESHAASMKVIEEARKDLATELAKVKDGVKQEVAKTVETLRGQSDTLVDEIVRKIMSRGA